MVRGKKSKPSKRNYKAEYQRRVKNAAKKGKTRQQARGHKPKEHVARKAREIQEHGITTAQMKSIRDWCRKYNNEIRTCEEVIDEAKAQGFAWYQKYRDTWNAARKKYLQELKNKSWASRGQGYLDMLAAEAKVDDSRWLYYH